MSAPRGLHGLARLHGIQTAYRDAEGRRVSASPEALLATLRALGVELAGGSDVPSRLDHRRRVLEDRVVEPVTVIWIPGGAPKGAGRVRVRTPVRHRDRPIRIRIELEGGGERVSALEPGPLGGTVLEGSGGPLVVRDVPLPPVPAGYHRLELEIGTGPSAHRYEALIIAAPAAAAGWTALPGHRAGKPAWGLFAPLYGLWETGRPGPPDYGLLARLAERAAAAGASVVGTLPLLAAFLDRPYEPSPYAPVSRLFWNEAYVAEAVQGHPGHEPTGAWAAFDARAAMALRRPVLERAARTLWAEGGSDGGGSSGSPGLGAPAALAPFLARNPRAEDYARFRALTEARGPWPGWPARLRARDVRPGDFDPAAARYHLYAQWRADAELAEAAARAAGFGVGLYLDLPLGVHPDGYDTWRERALFAHGATAGAPPDPLAPGGQDWGFPPVVPERSRLEGHRYFAASVRTQLRHASVLRIDHVMQLHRMFWIATGDARDGVYVRYPADELCAILCLESQRAGAVVVGEDLGTVPREVRRTMRRHGIPGMYVLQFELTEAADPAPEGMPGPEPAAHEGGRPLVPKRVPSGSLASIGTHDTPSFAEWWWGGDVRRRLAMGWVSEDGAADELAGRAEMRRKLLRGMGLGIEDPGSAGATAREEDGPSGSAGRAHEALLRRLGSSRAGLVLATLEDLWLEPEPQNVPGTTGPANWSRRLARPLDAIAEADLARVLRALDDARIESGEGVS